jgi:hypothetical protein
LGKLTEQEEYFVKNLQDTSWRFNHGTHANLISKYLDDKEKFNIFSAKMLPKEKRQCENESEKIALSNDDFVFFSLELGATLEAERPGNAVYQSERPGGIVICQYGHNLYILEEGKSSITYGYLTLTKHYSDGRCYLACSKLEDKKEFFSHLFAAEQERMRQIVDEHWKGKDTTQYLRKILDPISQEVPMFSYSHMKEGLALYSIKEIRELRQDDATFADWALNSQPGSEEMDIVSKVLFWSEFQVPRIVSSTDISKKKEFTIKYPLGDNFLINMNIFNVV